MKLEDSRTVYVALRGFQHGFDVAHYRFQILAFVQEHAVPVGYLVLPVLLPFAQGIFLQELVCADNQHGCGSFEAYTAFDTDNRVAYVHVAADAVCCTDLFHFLDGFDGIVECLVVHGF